MKNLIVVVALVLLVSCSAVPKQAGHPLTYQDKMQAGRHWEELSQEVVDNLALPNNSIVCISDRDRSMFGKSMRMLLKTELVNHGLFIVDEAKCATDNATSSPSFGHAKYDGIHTYELTWDVQPVFHNAARYGNNSLLWSLIVDPFQAIFIGGADDHRYPHSEVIVTFELLRNGLPQQWRYTKIFYVNDADYRNHYWETARAGSLAGSLSVIRYKVTGK